MGVIRGSSYYTIVDGRSWTQAENQAIALGGNLAAINNWSENIFISNSFKDENKGYYGGDADKDIYWIGLTKESGSWGWSNGDSFSYSNWGPKEPFENSGVNDRAEIIVQAHGGPWGQSAGNWNNNSDIISPLGRYGIAEVPLSYFSISNVEVEEGEKAKIKITRTGGTSTEQTLILATSDGSAVAGDDYKNKTKTITFAAGETSKTVNIVTNEDSRVESDEKINLTLSASSGDAVPAQISDGTATVTITDDDQPTYSINPTVSSSNEGGEVRTNVSTTGVDAGTRLYWTLSGTGIDADDFSVGDLKGSRLVKSDGTITFAHTLASDLTTEGSETLNIKLFSDWQRTVQVGDTASVTINDTSLTPAESIFSIDGTNVWEGNKAQVLITRKGNTSAAIDLTLNTVNSTASSGSDYTQIKDKTISFAAGVTSKKVSITTLEDSAVESNETLEVTISSSNDLAQFNTKTATVTIEDDDQSVINNTNFTYNYYNSNNTTVNSNNTTTTSNSNNSLSSWNIYRVDQTVKVRDIVSQWFTDATPANALKQDVTDTKLLDVVEKTWSDKVQINRVVQAAEGGGELIQGKQINKDNWTGATGSVLNGSAGGETLRGLAGWDVIDGGDGDDLIHGGNGRDIITGGKGSDELHGDFGWNTYKDQRDGSSDLIAIKSDQHLSNWWYGTSGNSPNGEKADFIEGLDARDQIKIIGVSSQDLSFQENVTARGVSGIGIYAKGTLEAVYTGGDLTIGQITQMTSGDGSELAMANQMWSYWGDNTVPDLLA